MYPPLWPAVFLIDLQWSTLKTHTWTGDAIYLVVCLLGNRKRWVHPSMWTHWIQCSYRESCAVDIFPVVTEIAWWNEHSNKQDCRNQRKWAGKWFGVQSACLACTKPWGQSPPLHKLNMTMYIHNLSTPGGRARRTRSSKHPWLSLGYQGQLTYKSINK